MVEWKKSTNRLVQKEKEIKSLDLHELDIWLISRLNGNPELDFLFILFAFFNNQFIDVVNVFVFFFSVRFIFVCRLSNCFVIWMTI